MDSDIELAVYKAISQLPLSIDEVAMLVESIESDLTREHNLDVIQVASLRNWVSHEQQRYRMMRASSANQFPSDEDIEKIS